MKNILLALMSVFTVAAMTGCATPWITNTTRNSVEQYLLSTTIDRALTYVDFSRYSGKKIFMDYKYFTPQVDKEQAQGILEQNLAKIRITIAAKQEDSDYTVQPICGVLATDHSEMLLGTPALPVPLPNTNLNVVVPEIPIFKRQARYAYGKFAFTITDSKTGKPVETIHGLRSSSRYYNWVVLFIPFDTHDMDMRDSVEGSINFVFPN